MVRKPWVRPSLPQIRDALQSFDRELAREKSRWRKAALAMTLFFAAMLVFTVFLALSVLTPAKPPVEKEPDALKLWRR